MTVYLCQFCDFSTKIKKHYFRHLNTNKHNINKDLYYQKKENYEKSLMRVTINGHQNDHKMTINGHSRPFFCSHCKSHFTTKAHLARHQKSYCKVIKFSKKNGNFENLDSEKSSQILIEPYDTDPKTHLFIINSENDNKTVNSYQNTTNNIKINKNCGNNSNNTELNNCGNVETNITINNYGKENLEMLSKKFLTNMVQYPYSAIPKMIKKIHFNDNYPENKNIRMLNKKDSRIQTLKEGYWIYVDKNETIDELIGDKNYQMDKFYCENKNLFDNIHQQRYETFQSKISGEDRTLMKNLKNSTDIIFWNNM